MMICKPGDIVLVDFPFVSGNETRRRPALVILDTGNADLIAARVTSQARQDAFDVEIVDWRGAGLVLPSVARLHKLATLDRSMIVRTLGHLQTTDRQSVARILATLFSEWKNANG
jgi:mRNA interferase MazF